MSQFAYRLRPARLEMLSASPTEAESRVVMAHYEYLKDLAGQGTVLMAGRTLVADESTFGIVVLEAEDEAAARAIMEADPAVANGVMRAEFWPFRVALRPGPPESPFLWHELVTPDQEASGAFFCALLGWDRRQVDAGRFGTYTLFQRGGQDVAGMMNPTPDMPVKGPFWHAYVKVDDVDARAARAKALGGTVLVPPHDVEGVGRICAIADPAGAVAHLMQPNP